MREEDWKHALVTEKLKKSVLFRLSALNPSISLNSGHASFIEDRLQHIFKSFHTPSHPPYALMIKRAIRDLDEENGSTEEAISECMKRDYDDLPWAHIRILDVHLRKLCLDGVLVCNESRYMLLIDNSKGEKCNSS